MTTIEWTEKTWNPITGCLEEPLNREKPTMYFVADSFCESVTDEQLDQAFVVMALTPQHTYQVLTKRLKRLLEYTSELRTRLDASFRQEPCVRDIELRRIANKNWPLPNVWLGVTVENQKAANERIPLLLQTPAAIRFLGCEPLLEEIDLSGFPPFCWEPVDPETQKFLKEIWGDRLPDNSLNAIASAMKIDWVIVGGESGSKARPFQLEGASSIVHQCKESNIPVFVKQLGSKPFMNGQPLNLSGKGNDISEWPEDLRVREMPKV